MAWRPDGLLFACGHEDGCISFWHIEDDEKPITVRTIDRVEVDKPGAAAMDLPLPLPAGREPIFKLAWSGFPPASFFAMAQGTGRQAHHSSDQHGQDESATGTILTVLGGSTERHPPGLVCLHFPAFSWPYSSYWNSSSPEAHAKTRQALFQSLVELHGSRYSTPSAVEDFLLVPRENPYYHHTFDPIAVITLIGPDPNLSPLPPPAASRGLKAFAFPPPIDLKNALQPENSQAYLGIQFPFAQRPLSLPLALSTAGPGAILGAHLIDVSSHIYRNLTGHVDISRRPDVDPASPREAASASSMPKSVRNALPLRGGKAKPNALGVTSDSPEAFATLARAERFRLLITWHLDGTVRFQDASPHLLLISSMHNRLDREGDTMPSSGYLDFGFPHPLPHLTIDVRHLINSPQMSGHALFDKLRADPKRLQISHVKFASEALETIVALRTGQVFHYKFGFAKSSETSDVIEAVHEEVQQDEAMAAASVQSPRSPSSNHHSVLDLDNAMAGAMDELAVSDQAPQFSQAPFSPPRASHMSGVSSNNGSPVSAETRAPPVRPKRDPKRLSMARKIGLGRSSQERSSITSNHSKEIETERQTHSSEHQHPFQPTSFVDEITFTGHLASWEADGFKPNIVLELMRGEVTAMEISDIGFVAIAYGPSLAVIDLRGPEIMVREGFGEGMPGKSDTSREERKMIEEECKSSISYLHMSVCRTSVTPILSPTLIATRESGYTTFWSFGKSSLDIWMSERSYGAQIDELKKGVGVQVLDLAGNVCHTSPAELQRSLREQARGVGLDSSVDMNLLLCIGRQTLSLRAGLTGARIAKVEVNEEIVAASVVDRRGEKVCLVISPTSLWIFALPHMRLVQRIQRHNRAHEERLSLAQTTTSMDSSGDFIEVANSLGVSMWTIFATMPRPGLPSVLLYTPPTMPMAPNALGNYASGLANWIGGKSSALTQGAQLDEFLAGPKRPEAPKLPEPKYQSLRQEEIHRRHNHEEEMMERDRSSAGPSTAGASSRLHPVAHTQREAQNAAGTASWSLDLAKQRGEMMNNLEQGLSSLERGATEWMKSAREEMVKQAARDKLNKFF